MKKNHFDKRIIKQIVLMIVLLVVATSPIFAASGDTIGKLDEWGEKVLALFQSSWVKVILLVALILEAIGMVVMGQQGGGGAIIKKFAPWIIGTIILLSASGICSYFTTGMEFTVS